MPFMSEMSSKLYKIRIFHGTLKVWVEKNS